MFGWFLRAVARCRNDRSEEGALTAFEGNVWVPGAKVVAVSIPVHEVSRRVANDPEIAVGPCNIGIMMCAILPTGCEHLLGGFLRLTRFNSAFYTVMPLLIGEIVDQSKPGRCLSYPCRRGGVRLFFIHDFIPLVGDI